MNSEKIYITRVQKVGNSLELIIPADIARAMGIHRGDYCRLDITNNMYLIARRITDRDFSIWKKSKPSEPTI